MGPGAPPQYRTGWPASALQHDAEAIPGSSSLRAASVPGRHGGLGRAGVAPLLAPVRAPGRPRATYAIFEPDYRRSYINGWGPLMRHPVRSRDPNVHFE